MVVCIQTVAIGIVIAFLGIGGFVTVRHPLFGVSGGLGSVITILGLIGVGC